MAPIKIRTVNSYLLIFLLLAVSQISYARESIVFSCGLEEADPQFSEVNLLLLEAFDALNMDFTLISTPGLRGIAMAVSAQVDGDCARMPDFIEINQVSNLVRINSPVIRVSLQAWSHSSDVSVEREENLEKLGSRIGYRRGVLLVKRYLDRLQGVNKISVESDSIGLKMLSVKRLDIYVGVGLMIDNNLKKMILKNPVYLAGTFATVDFYPYLNAKHQYLVEPLSLELNRLMKARGKLPH